MTTATNHIIPTTKSIYDNGEKDCWNRGHFKSPAMIKIEGAYAANPLWGVGGWTAEGKGRKEHGGAIEAGPHAYINGRAMIIDNFGGTGREMREKKEDGLFFVVRDGDTLTIRGTTYTLNMVRGFPKLTEVA